jgi:hypothetical protein
MNCKKMSSLELGIGGVCKDMGTRHQKGRQRKFYTIADRVCGNYKSLNNTVLIIFSPFSTLSTLYFRSADNPPDSSSRNCRPLDPQKQNLTDRIRPIPIRAPLAKVSPHPSTPGAPFAKLPLPSFSIEPRVASPHPQSALMKYRPGLYLLID